jgi:hypothetical protein
MANSLSRLAHLVMTSAPNHFSGAVAGCTPEFIEMMPVGVGHKSGSARLRRR